MLPEYRIFGGLVVLAILASVWLAIAWLFGPDVAWGAFGAIALLLVVLMVGAYLYGRAKAVAAWARERWWWWAGPESAIRVLLRWNNASGDPSAVAAALRALPDSRVHERSLDGETALHAAIRLHCVLGEEFQPILEQLLAAGADPNARYEYSGKTPLDYVEYYSAPPQAAERLRGAGAVPSRS